MSLSVEHVKALAASIGLDIPADDLPLVASRLASIIDEMAWIEAEYGSQLDEIDPIPSLTIDEEALR